MKKGLLLLLFIPFLAFAQENEPFMMGSLVDDEAYASIPVKAKQLTRSYANLPSRCSLRSFCPTPMSQGQYGTCTSWAVAYAARTIMEAETMGLTNSDQLSQEAFSPSFVYAKIKHDNDPNCQNGSFISDALNLLKRQGVPKMASFHTDCASYIPDNVQHQASSFVIKDYFTLFSSDASVDRKISATKMALAQGRPIVISMECYKSFSNAGHCWNGDADVLRGHHAMCVVGYDDDVEGGAFQLMNSWGTWWGEGGFTWVRYSDFGRYVRYGYEMYLDKSHKASSKTLLSGNMEIRLATGSPMRVELKKVGTDWVYKALHGYPSGTRYRIYLTNNQPAYVYVIGADMRGSADLLFPPSPKVSPALVYSSNNIAIPDEEWYIEMDNTVGTDYLWVIYSPSELPIDDIIREMRGSQESFAVKASRVYNSFGVNTAAVEYNNTQVAFSCNTPESFVPIVIEIPHN